MFACNEKDRGAVPLRSNHSLLRPPLPFSEDSKRGKKERELVPGYPGEETRASLKKQNFWVKNTILA